MSWDYRTTDTPTPPSSDVRVVHSWDVFSNIASCPVAGRAESWQPIRADQRYIAAMRRLWLRAWQTESITRAAALALAASASAGTTNTADSDGLDDAVVAAYLRGDSTGAPATTGPPCLQTLDPSLYTLVPPDAVPPDSAVGPTSNSTGLGLPLSRALAKAGGGWLGLSDSSSSTAGGDSSAGPSGGSSSSSGSGNASGGGWAVRKGGGGYAVPSLTAFTASLASTMGRAVGLTRSLSTTPPSTTWYWCVMLAPDTSGGSHSGSDVTAAGQPHRRGTVMSSGRDGSRGKVQPVDSETPVVNGSGSGNRLGCNDIAGASRVIPPILSYFFPPFSKFLYFFGLLLFLRDRRCGRRLRHDRTVFCSCQSTGGPPGGVC